MFQQIFLGMSVQFHNYDLFEQVYWVKSLKQKVSSKIIDHSYTPCSLSPLLPKITPSSVLRCFMRNAVNGRRISPSHQKVAYFQHQKDVP